MQEVLRPTLHHGGMREVVAQRLQDSRLPIIDSNGFVKHHSVWPARLQMCLDVFFHAGPCMCFSSCLMFPMSTALHLILMLLHTAEPHPDFPWPG